MAICHELGKTEEEVAHWTLQDLYRWHAFFRLKNEASERAMQQARNQGSNGMRGSNVTVITE